MPRPFPASQVPARGPALGHTPPASCTQGPSLSPHSGSNLRKATAPGLGRTQEEQTRGTARACCPWSLEWLPVSGVQHVSKAQCPWATAPERVGASQMPRSRAAESSAGIHPAESACLVHLPSCCGHRACPWLFCPGRGDRTQQVTHEKTETAVLLLAQVKGHIPL